MIQEEIRKSITEALNSLDLSIDEIDLEHPADFSHGDYSTNVAMVLAKQVEQNPRQLAEKIAAALNKPNTVEKIEIAGPGFINFHLSRQFFADSITEILQAGDTWGRNESLADKKIIVEYTDPNPFKEFHTGHLMGNAIGESISRLLEASGAEVKRANYQGDIGLHVAKAVWGKLENTHATWGEAYVYGAQNYEENKEVIDEINKKIYQNDKEIMPLYNSGRVETLKEFENLYQKLGMELRDSDTEGQMHFDNYFYESETWETGKEMVEKNVGKVFEKSDGAVVFRGEKHGLHTRVFITSKGLPTYEAKELGLFELKQERLTKSAWEQMPDISVVLTGNDIRDYFKVILQAAKEIGGEIAVLAGRTKHLTHGMMRLPSGKMSSRTGDVVTAISLIDEVAERVKEKMRNSDISDKETIAEHIAVGAIKYSILKQTAEKNIIFDFDRSLSFEGDSGPYLQYSYARARSVLEKAKEDNIEPSTTRAPSEVTDVERLIYRFSEVVLRARTEYEPHYVTTYLTLLAGAFNSWYGREKILDGTDKSAYKLALAEATAITLKNGLWLLGIKAPERM